MSIVNSELNTVLRRLGIADPPCSSEVGKGWLPAVERALEKLIAAGWGRKLDQVKQKFCQLRIYISGTNPELENIIEAAVRECDNLCEKCGEERELKGSRSGMAYCNKCLKSKLRSK